MNVLSMGGSYLEVGGWRLEVGGWRLEVGGWRLAVGGWRLEWCSNRHAQLTLNRTGRNRAGRSRRETGVAGQRGLLHRFEVDLRFVVIGHRTDFVRSRLRQIALRLEDEEADLD